MLSKSISLRSAPHVGIGLRSNSCRPFSRVLSIHSGSFLRVEIPRTTDSLSPRCAAAPAASSSCQPNSYCPRLASSGRSISTSDIVTLSSGPQRCHPPRHSCASGGVPKRDAARWAQSSGAVLHAYTVSDAERDAPASDPLILQGSAAAPGGRTLPRPRPERIPRRRGPMAADPTTSSRAGILAQILGRGCPRASTAASSPRPGRRWSSRSAIVGTGGLVRLTGSGLGCPTWPQCTAESLVPTPEMGIHGVIEFGNRMLTFVLVVVAIVMFLFVVRMRRERRDLFWLALVNRPVRPAAGDHRRDHGADEPQPLRRGAALLRVGRAGRARRGAGRAGLRRSRSARTRRAGAGSPSSRMSRALVVLITVVVGILVTGSGPHAGDGGAARNGLDPEFMQHVHSWPAYALLAHTIVLVVGVVAHSAAPAPEALDGAPPRRRGRPDRRGTVAGARGAADRAREHPHGARSASRRRDDRGRDAPDGACGGCPGRFPVRWIG